MACLSVLGAACAHGPTNEQRLDLVGSAETIDEASDIRCRDTSPEVQIARDHSHAKTERLQRYSWAIAEAKATEKRFDEAFKKDPDLQYGAEAGEWKKRQRGCVDLALTLERERSAVEREADAAPAAATAPASAPAVEEKAAAADEAFSAEDTEALAKPYKKNVKASKAAKKAKVAKAAKKKKSGRSTTLAAR